MGRTRRVSYTSGTVLFAEFLTNVINTSPDSLTASPYTYSAASPFAISYANVQARHPATPVTGPAQRPRKRRRPDGAHERGLRRRARRRAVHPVAERDVDRRRRRYVLEQLGANRQD